MRRMAAGCRERMHPPSTRIRRPRREIVMGRPAISRAAVVPKATTSFGLTIAISRSNHQRHCRTSYRLGCLRRLPRCSCLKCFTTFRHDLPRSRSLSFKARSRRRPAGPTGTIFLVAGLLAYQHERRRGGGLTNNGLLLGRALQRLSDLGGLVALKHATFQIHVCVTSAVHLRSLGLFLSSSLALAVKDGRPSRRISNFVWAETPV
jgi:hypothetical protein